MAENKIKEIESPESSPVEKPKRRSVKSARRILRYINIFGVFDRNQIVHAMPFILFITLLTIIYIGNSYYAEKMIREIDRTKSELKEKKAEYISTERDLMTKSQQTEVAHSLQATGIREATQPPQIIKTAEKNKPKHN